MVEFTDEEGYGKYLDLHECYEKYVNLKGIEVFGSLYTLAK
jgi:splicing factor 3A subunit 3